VVALVAVLAAVSPGPPSPVLHSRGQELVAARGSYCWTGPAEDGTQRGICVDTVAPVTEDALTVVRRGRVQVSMRTEAESLSATLRGREGQLRVRRVRDSERRFVVRLPRRLGKRPVLDLFARYPQGDGFFGARLRLP
jgi:hypothetical protein